MGFDWGKPHKNLGFMARLLISWCIFATIPIKSHACTTAAWLAANTTMGAPFIWKNRDTDTLWNRVVFVNAKPYHYVGLTDAHETSGRAVYAGLNENGFGIINSVAYNLPKVAPEMVDLEGFVMADVLRTARRVGDFERYLTDHLGPDLGSQANFLVFDGEGEVWLFEVHNNGFEKFSVASTSEKYLVNTNFARSGAPGKGAGYLRFERASRLIAAHPGLMDLGFIINSLARDFGHSLLTVPSVHELGQRSIRDPLWLSTTETINRDSTASSVLLQGRQQTPIGTPSLATMWVSLGEPVASLAVPIWVEAGRIPQALSKGTRVPLQETAMELKKLLRPFAEAEKQKYLNLSLLNNKESIGTLTQLENLQNTILKQTTTFLGQPRTSEQLAQFQDSMAEFALTSLKKILSQLKQHQGSMIP
jgi:hypothetical protein